MQKVCGTAVMQLPYGGPPNLQGAQPPKGIRHVKMASPKPQTLPMDLPKTTEQPVYHNDSMSSASEQNPGSAASNMEMDHTDDEDMIQAPPSVYVSATLDNSEDDTMSGKPSPMPILDDAEPSSSNLPNASMRTSSAAGDTNTTTETVSVDNNNTEVTKKRRKRKSFAPISTDESKRSTRTRATEAEVVNNYAREEVPPRPLYPPIGSYREPYFLNLGVHKEKNRLMINMVGPNAGKAESSSRKNPTQLKINQGLNFQAVIPEYREREDMDQYHRPGEDELLWVAPESLPDNTVKLDYDLLDKAWIAVRAQKRTGRKIGLDDMMWRLMKCDYDILKTVNPIEELQFELRQPKLKMNVIQREEFEKLLKGRDVPGRSKENERIFRTIQEKVLPTWYLGEVMEEYYATKHKNSGNELLNICKCRTEELPQDEFSDRIQCFSCNDLVWGGSRTFIPHLGLCSVCSFYKDQSRDNEDEQKRDRRLDPNYLHEDEERAVEKWERMMTPRMMQKTRIPVKIEEVMEALELDRRDKIRKNITDVMEKVKYFIANSTKRTMQQCIREACLKKKILQIPHSLSTKRSGRLDLDVVYGWTSPYKPKYVEGCLFCGGMDSKSEENKKADKERDHVPYKTYRELSTQQKCELMKAIHKFTSITEVVSSLSFPCSYALVNHVMLRHPNVHLKHTALTRQINMQIHHNRERDRIDRERAPLHQVQADDAYRPRPTASRRTSPSTALTAQAMGSQSIEATRRPARQQHMPDISTAKENPINGSVQKTMCYGENVAVLMNEQQHRR